MTDRNDIAQAMTDEEWRQRNALGQGGAGGYNFPGIQLDTRGFAVPRVGVDLSTPFAGGTLGLSGSYQRTPGEPEYGAMLRYRRQF